jgi:hypothetical protein
MPSSRVTIKIVIGFLALLLTGGNAAAAELSTLFTTPQERELIDSNRYGSGDKKPKIVVEDTIEAPVQQIYQEEVTRQYKISGITISRDGPHTVWINSSAYEDGGELEDKSRIKVMVGDEIRVRITAPDGKNYYATSGETLEVSYLASIEN